ncbi:MAG: threonine/serine dehydratase [Pseudomonadota bacterium]
MSNPNSLAGPAALEAARALRRQIDTWIVRTPVLRATSIEDALTGGTRVSAKLEFLQRTGTFKARGALANLARLSAAERSAGVTAVSAGNHAIAVAYAARVHGVDAKVVMLSTASPLRVQRCRDYGADVVLVDNVHDAFRAAENIQTAEGRSFIHPFEGESVALGTATLGIEICEQIKDIDILIVPVGGGGLCGGVSMAVKQLSPATVVIGVEPEGADSMYRSFEADEPQSIDRVETIADSLGAPYALPESFALCRANVERIVRVSDDDLKAAMRFLFNQQKIAVEPACAASTAAVLGPLASEVCGQHVALLMCGSNTDWQTFASHSGL